MFHPTAKDLLVLATNDAGKASIRLFNLSLSQESLVAPLEATGVFNIVWSLDGSRLAAATKDGRIVILDPRDISSAISGKAHDSPRSFQLAWISDSHLVSVGFSRGSQRRINLYKVTSEGVETIHSLLIDVSPSVLFPVYDPDTCILYVWGKGERQIQAYEVHPENPTEPIAKIPSYTSGTPQLGLTFFPKAALDVKKVEVAKALRLTAKTIEEVTFTIPRNKVCLLDTASRQGLGLTSSPTFSKTTFMWIQTMSKIHPLPLTSGLTVKTSHCARSASSRKE